MRRALFVLLATAALACQSDLPGGPAATPGLLAYATNGRLTISQWDIYVMNPNGTGQALVDPSLANDQMPDWSPDGQHIAFVSDRTVRFVYDTMVNGIDTTFVTDTIANVDIYTINANGLGVTRLTFDTMPDIQPAWSPDGTTIAFATARDSGDYEIYTMDVNGLSLKRLTASPGEDGMPAWSPDGTKIAFSSTRGGHPEIYVMNAADGSGVVQLTNTAASDYTPAWSPDGTKIAFTRDVGGPSVASQQIWVMNADGSGQTQLSHHNSFSAESPSWSHDGTRIAYDADGDVWIMWADGSQPTQVTKGFELDVTPRWRP